jgi:CHASE3 domain sensor protein
MMTPVQVEGRSLTPTVVFVLVVVAMGLSMQAYREVQAIKRQAAANQQLRNNLNQLLHVTDDIAQHRRN